MIYVITLTCANNHTQDLELRGVSRDWAEGQAGLLDGTSPLFLYPPGEDSVIGKCGICGARISSVVTERQGEI